MYQARSLKTRANWSVQGKSEQREEEEIKQITVGVKNKGKSIDNCSLGRGRTSFHYIKQKARTVHKRSKEGDGGTMVSSKHQKGQKLERNQVIISSDLRDMDTTSESRDFGEKIGVVWVRREGADNGQGVWIGRVESKVRYVSLFNFSYEGYFT